MTLSTDRRTFLRVLGGSLALPLLSQVIPSSANAQPLSRSRFIGVFFPNGAHMPDSSDGNWNFDEALAPLAAAGHRNNTMIIRGLHNGFDGIDPHWQNCAGFLSCRRIVLGDAAVARCGKSLDQVVPEHYPTAMTPKICPNRNSPVLNKPMRLRLPFQFPSNHFLPKSSSSRNKLNPLRKKQPSQK